MKNVFDRRRHMAINGLLQIDSLASDGQNT